MGKRWTDKEDNVLATMRDAGTTYREIASIMGRSEASCQQRAFSLGKAKKQTKPKVAQGVTPVANLYQEASYPLDLDYTFLKPRPTLLERIINKLLGR
jgi:hypothetical protein